MGWEISFKKNTQNIQTKMQDIIIVEISLRSPVNSFLMGKFCLQAYMYTNSFNAKIGDFEF